LASARRNGDRAGDSSRVSPSRFEVEQGAQGIWIKLHREPSMKKEKREIRTRRGPLVWFLIYVIIAGIIGMMVNNRYYAVEKNDGSVSPTER
jgi:hypothetical protein